MIKAVVLLSGAPGRAVEADVELLRRRHGGLWARR